MESVINRKKSKQPLPGREGLRHERGASTMNSLRGGALPGTVHRQSVGQTALSSPETAIRLVLEAGQSGSWWRAAQYFQAGTLALEDAEGRLKAITDSGRAQGFRVESTTRDGMELLLGVTTYADPDLNLPLETQTWRFLRCGAGWLITEVK
jgi:hypothetical protein